VGPDRPTIVHASADVLVVASWYPGIEDPVAGRFVADQVEATAATGRARLAVVSFEDAALTGSGRRRDALAALTRDLAATATRTHPSVFSARGHGLASGVPVARLTIPSGRRPAAGAGHAAVARQDALAALGERWLAADSGVPLLAPRPALIHAHTGYPDGAAAADLARALECPLVITEHASYIARQLAAPEVGQRYRAAIERAIRVVAVSRTLATELIELVPEIEPKVVVIPNAVDIDAFQLAPPARSRGRELLFVGHRKPTKGIGILLRALPSIRERHPDVTLRLIGRSPDEATEAAWHRLAAELGIGDAVAFDGQTDRSGVAAAMRRAALFVHPSPRETFGVVAAEALAAGVPVVAVDSGGVTELLGDDPDALGAVVPADDPEALANAVARTLDRLDAFDPDILRASVTTRYGSATVASRIADLYEEVLADGGPAGHGARPQADLEAARPHVIRVVVAFDPDRAKHVTSLSDAARARLVVVTSAPPPPLDGVAAVIESRLGGSARTLADAGALGPPVRGVRRVLRALRHPVAVARRRGLLPGLERLIRTRGTAAIEAAMRRATTVGGGGSGEIELVCLDALDHEAAAALVRRRQARLAPGGLSSLADRAEAEVSPPEPR